MYNNETLTDSGRPSPRTVQMMNALSSKSAKSPVVFVKDNRLQGFTPRKENMFDFLPQKLKMPSPKYVRPDESYPLPTKWNQDQFEKRKQQYISQKLAHDIDEEYRKARNLSYSHHLVR